MHLWLFGMGVLVAFVLLTLGGLGGLLSAFAWGFVVCPHGARWLQRRGRTETGKGDDVELETAYWRTTSWRSGVH